MTSAPRPADAELPDTNRPQPLGPTEPAGGPKRQGSGIGQPGFQPGPRTSTPPPQRPATAARMADLYLAGEEDTAAALMREVLESTQGYGSVPPSVVGPKPPDQRSDFPSDLKGVSLGVVRLLIWAEFSSRLTCVSPKGGKWSLKGGIPESRVLWTGSTKPLHKLSEVKADDLWKDIRGIRTDRQAKVEARSQNEAPELMMLLAFERFVAVATQSPRDLLDEYRRTFLLVDVVADVVALVVHQLKHLLQVPRPTELLQTMPMPPSALTPLMAVPEYRSFPGGHAALASALATVLGHVVPSSSGTLKTLAGRIAQNRVKMGFHTETDTREGLMLGAALGDHLVSGTTATDCPLWATVLQLAKEEF